MQNHLIKCFVWLHCITVTCNYNATGTILSKNFVIYLCSLEIKFLHSSFSFYLWALQKDLDICLCNILKLKVILGYITLFKILIRTRPFFSPLQDFAMHQGIVAESFETSVPWDRCSLLCRSVKQRIVSVCDTYSIFHRFYLIIASFFRNVPSATLRTTPFPAAWRRPTMPGHAFTSTLVSVRWAYPIRWRYSRPLSTVHASRSSPVAARCPIIMAWARYAAIGIAMRSPRRAHRSTPPPSSI